MNLTPEEKIEYILTHREASDTLVASFVHMANIDPAVAMGAATELVASLALSMREHSAAFKAGAGECGEEGCKCHIARALVFEHLLIIANGCPPENSEAYLSAMGGGNLGSN